MTADVFSSAEAAVRPPTYSPKRITYLPKRIT
jgi:hypothetical protein